MPAAIFGINYAFHNSSACTHPKYNCFPVVAQIISQMSRPCVTAGCLFRMIIRDGHYTAGLPPGSGAGLQIYPAA